MPEVPAADRNSNVKPSSLMRVSAVLSVAAALGEVIVPVVVGASNGCDDGLWLPLLGIASVLSVAALVLGVQAGRKDGWRIARYLVAIALLTAIAVPVVIVAVVNGCAIAWWS